MAKDRVSALCRALDEQVELFRQRPLEGAYPYLPGRWLGQGAVELGLRGEVGEGEMSALMAGRDPKTGNVLRERDVEVGALDLTFSAPKSVSVLFAAAPADVAGWLVSCHEEAVEAALAYVEETAAFVRRGKGGASFEHAGGLVTAAFRHRMSRALDPQLHTHCVTANMAKGADGRWTALHHPSLYQAARTAGYLYQAHLRALISRRLGLEWGAVQKGTGELVGVEKGVLEEFSRRRHEMQRAAAQDGGLGLDTKRRSQAAAIATRERKQYGIETHTWREEVQARASEHGLDRPQISKLVSRGKRRVEQGRIVIERDPDAERALADRLAGPGGLTELQNTFHERDVLRELAQDAQQGATVAEVREHGGRFADRVDVFGTRAGERTTAELVGVERRLIAAAAGRAGEGVGRVDDQTVAGALAAVGRPLNSEQQAAIHATVSSGHGVQVIEALAGTGKTYTAGVLRYVYERAGYQVIGVAPTGRAVRELVDEAGVASRTLDSRVLSIGKGYALPAGCVVIFDEAGMAPTRKTAVLLEAAEQAGGKVVVIGDPGQLHSVQAGGWMRAVGRKVGTLKLSEVMRQRDPAERRALAALHEGTPKRWLQWAGEHDRIELGENTKVAVDRALEDWQSAVAQHGLPAAALITRDNDTRRVLNDRAREVVREQGGLGAELVYGPVSVAVGDRVICRLNDRDVDVDNGTRGTVRHVAQDKLVLETDSRLLRELPAGYVAEHLEHAYALTGHGVQGATVERAGVVATPHELTRGWSYTALSRARGTTKLFVRDDEGRNADRDEQAPREPRQQSSEPQLLARVERYMLTRDDEDLAVEQLPPVETLERAELAAGEAPGEVLQEAAADRAEPTIERSPTSRVLYATSDRLAGLGAQLEALSTPEVGRLQAAERREHELWARHDELLMRVAALPEPSRLPWARDQHASERANLDQGLAGVQAELHGVQTLRSRLVRETGDLEAIRSERAKLEQAIATTGDELARLREDLVQQAIADPPSWATAALGQRPISGVRLSQQWESAVSAAVGYRLEQRIENEPTLLGERPADPDAARRYDAAARTVEQAQQRLGVDRPEPGREVSLPRRYERLLGEQRAERLLGTLREASAQVGSLDHEQLTSLAKAGRDAIAQLDEQAAQQTTRLEHEREQHHQAIGDLAARRQSLTEQAGELGWRQRHERDHLRAAAASQEQYLARHQADIERAELALQRLAAAGRHPDQWIERYGRQFVEGLAAEYALDRSRERTGDREPDRGHAREQQREQLARDDERELGLER